jgi:tetratricopeptide (TPR) repeat protein
LLALLAFTTWQRALLWGHPDQLAALWAARNPESPRAQASASLQLMQAGRYDQAAALLWLGIQKTPGDVQLAFNYVNARCLGPGLAPRDREMVTGTISKAKSGHLLIYQWLSHALEVAKEGSCAGLDLDTAELWVDTAMRNHALAAAGRRDEDFGPLFGELAVYRGLPALALQHFTRALRAHPNPDFAARMVAFLARHEMYAQALSLLDVYQQLPAPKQTGLDMAHLHAIVLDHYDYWPREFAVLRTQLDAALAAQAEAEAGK